MSPAARFSFAEVARDPNQGGEVAARIVRDARQLPHAPLARLAPEESVALSRAAGRRARTHGDARTQGLGKTR
jgi:hypothetical protein